MGAGGQGGQQEPRMQWKGVMDVGGGNLIPGTLQQLPVGGAFVVAVPQQQALVGPQQQQMLMAQQATPGVQQCPQQPLMIMQAAPFVMPAAQPGACQPQVFMCCEQQQLS